MLGRGFDALTSDIDEDDKDENNQQDRIEYA